VLRHPQTLPSGRTGHFWVIRAKNFVPIVAGHAVSCSRRPNQVSSGSCLRCRTARPFVGVRADQARLGRANRSRREPQIMRTRSMVMIDDPGFIHVQRLAEKRNGA